MKLNSVVLPLFLLGVSEARQACPLDSPSYPPPQNISTDASFLAATKSLTSNLDQKVKSSPYDGFSFSVSVFSASEEGLAWQYHHTSPWVKNSTRGTNHIDADSIYRIGSISKLLTVYLWLIRAGDVTFYDPITKYLPSLAQYASQSNELITASFEDITIGDLAGQMAGLARDFGLSDTSQPKNALAALPPNLAKAFPKVPESEIPQCGYLAADSVWVACTDEEFLNGVATEAPIFPTAYTPVYSNQAFALLGLALENITGLSMETMFNKSIVDALDLHNTYYTVPSSTPNAIIPGPYSWNNWNTDLANFGPVGGYFASTNDIATFGKSILNSEFLSKSVTNRWFKPSGFVENHDQGVGRPFEIFRRSANGQSVEVFVKGGDWGSYHTFFAVVPQYNIGFSVFTSQDPTSNPNPSLLEGGIPNFLVDPILAVVDDIAKSQAASTFAGHYTDTASNASLTVSTKSGESGLYITEWIIGGQNFLTFLAESIPGVVEFRILPNQLLSGNQVAFTSYYINVEPPYNGTWYWECPGWVDVDEINYGNIPIGQMVFDVGANGKANSVNLRALRSTLTKQS